MTASINFNTALTIEEARELVKGFGMSYPATDHNKKMIRMAMDEVLDNLRNK